MIYKHLSTRVFYKKRCINNSILMEWCLNIETWINYIPKTNFWGFSQDIVHMYHIASNWVLMVIKFSFQYSNWHYINDINHYAWETVYILQRAYVFLDHFQPRTFLHYSDVIISATVSQITDVPIVFSTVCCRSKKTSKLRGNGLCEGNPTVTSGFPS